MFVSFSERIFVSRALLHVIMISFFLIIIGDMHTKLKKFCDCPISCHSTRYEVTLSSSVFLSDLYNSMMQSKNREVPRDYYR
jgi:hypothetical protein